MIGYWWILIIYALGALISGSILPLWAFRIRVRIACGVMPESVRGCWQHIPAPFGIKWVEYRCNDGLREKDSSQGGCPTGGIFCIEVIGWPIAWATRLIRLILHSAPIVNAFSKTNRIWYYVFTTKEERVQQALGTLNTNAVNDNSNQYSPTALTHAHGGKWTTIPNPTGKYVP